MQTRQKKELGVKPSLGYVYGQDEKKIGAMAKTSSIWNHNSSIKSIRAEKEVLRENTMRRIDSMGFRAPVAWRDELYRNEL